MTSIFDITIVLYFIKIFSGSRNYWCIKMFPSLFRAIMLQSMMITCALWTNINPFVTHNLFVVLDMARFELQLILEWQRDGITSLIFAKITRKLGFVVLATAVSFYTIAVIINTAGSLNERSILEITTNKTLINTRSTAMTTMICHLRVLYVENHSKTLL